MAGLPARQRYAAAAFLLIVVIGGGLVIAGSMGFDLPGTGGSDRVFVKADIPYLTFMEDWVVGNEYVAYPPRTRTRTVPAPPAVLVSGEADAGIVGLTSLPRVLEGNEDMVIVAGMRFPPRSIGLYAAPDVGSVSDLDGGRIARQPTFIGNLTEFVLEGSSGGPSYETVTVPGYPAARQQLLSGSVDAAVLLERPGEGYAPLVYPFRAIEGRYGTNIYQSFVVADRDHVDWAWKMAQVANTTYVVAEDNIENISAAYQDVHGENLTRAMRENSRARVHPVTYQGMQAHSELLADLEDAGLIGRSTILQGRIGQR